MFDKKFALADTLILYTNNHVKMSDSIVHFRLNTVLKLLEESFCKK